MACIPSNITATRPSKNCKNHHSAFFAPGVKLWREEGEMELLKKIMLRGEGNPKVPAGSTRVGGALGSSVDWQLMIREIPQL